MPLLDGKVVLITGVVTSQSLAWHVARECVAHGAKVVLSVYRGVPLVRRLAEQLGPGCLGIVQYDVRCDEDGRRLSDWLEQQGVRLDGVLHAIAFAPPEAMGDHLEEVSWPTVSEALQSSAHSLAALVRCLRPHLNSPASIVALSFDSRFAWEGYGWMGVAKAALESSSRYLAMQLGPAGIRVNVVSAGPVRTMAALSVPSESDDYFADWGARAPVGWNPDDATCVGEACVALFSDLFSRTTGDLIFVDGGAHMTVA